MMKAHLLINRLAKALAFLFLCGCWNAQMIVAQELPRVFILDGNRLSEIKQSYSKGEKKYKKTIAKIVREAEKLSSQKPVSVTDKEQIPPSGDRHDYMSLAAYWWPDPSKSDGLPYLRRDGEKNPDVEKIPDGKNLSLTSKRVLFSSLAYYFTGKEEYATLCTEFLRVWFLNPDTRMNPHLAYAQAIRGRNTGRGSGVLDGRSFIQIVDGIGLLQSSPALTIADRQGLLDWFSQYYRWLTSSEHGLDESRAKNNHGSWYDAQTMSIALFLDRKQDVKILAEKAKTERIDRQIEPDGTQPFELERTRALGYSAFNISALTHVARLAEHVSVDLWNYSSADGRSIRKALTYLVPFIVGEAEWSGKQIIEFKTRDVYPILLLAAVKYHDESLLRSSKMIAGIDHETDINDLLTPEFEK